MENELQSLWQDVLSEMKKSVSVGNFMTFFKQTALVSLEENIATIAAPSPMVIDLLKKRFQAEIKQHLDSITKQNTILVFTIKSVSTPPSGNAGPLFTTEEKPKQLAIGHLPRVRSDYTFENFAVAGTNELAFASATTIAKNLGVMYNPFFLYGPVGVGKTHLMHAVANHVYQTTPDKKIIYITSEEFTNEVIDAIRNNETAKMKKRFRSAALLLIDDIQFIEGKERVQEELFHTFNILIDNGAQICLSSDRPPQEIKKLEKRLSSRFAGGLTVDVGLPDFELKTAIIQKKAVKFGYDLPIEVAKLLANNAEDTRSLEGLLLRIITQATLMNTPITLSLAQQALGQQVVQKSERLYADDVIRETCSFYGIKATQLKGPKRDASLVKARQVAMYLLKHELELTYVEIGNILGGRDHTTIMHGVDKMETLASGESPTAVDIKRITAVLHG